MIGLIDSFDVEYNGTENEALFKLVCDSAAELSSLTHYDNIKIRIGSECTDIATGDKYLKSSSAWVLQPQSMFANVYTKAEVDSMLNIQYQTMLYYHTVQTSTTGTITFYAFEGFVGSLTIYGNGQQTGTPTPDNPVMLEFVGVRTANLLAANGTVTINNVSVTLTNGHFLIVGTTNSEISSNNTAWKVFDFTLPAGTYYFKIGGLDGVGFYIKNYETSALLAGRNTSFTLEVETHCYIAFYIYKNKSGEERDIMLNSGSTALPYEPFGWAEKITCAGQTTPVYLGQVSTVRKIRKLVLDGEENWGYSTSENNARVYLAIDSMASSPSISTHYQFGTIRTYPILNEYCINNASDLIIGVDINSITSAADFKSYLAAQYAAGTPVTVWYVLATEQTGIVNEPLAKIGDYADELHSTDAGVSIPTSKGSNTLTVDTTLPPSKIEISGER